MFARVTGGAFPNASRAARAGLGQGVGQGPWPGAWQADREALAGSGGAGCSGPGGAQLKRVAVERTMPPLSLNTSGSCRLMRLTLTWS